MARALAFLCFFSLMCLCSNARAPPSPVSSSNAATADELALLSFKSMLSDGASSSSLAAWNTSGHYCTWPGVGCGRRHWERVVSLRLRSSNLTGRVSPALGNLSFLRELDLRNNQLAGELPPELGRLGRLRFLNLSTNYLQGSIPDAVGGCASLETIDLSKNQLEGSIPPSIGTLQNLTILNLEENGLTGEIPGSLAGLPSIEFLFLYSNRLSGEIPPALGNLSGLLHLDLDSNALLGSIPPSLGMLSGLSWLNVANNNLTGAIPASIWNLSSLWALNVQENALSGTLPPGAFSNLGNLVSVTMDNNRFHGRLPASLGNASYVTLLQLGFNMFSGTVPPELGRLSDLSWLLLRDTLLQAEKPKDWEFMTRLTNCSQLQFLELGYGKFGGVLPDSVSNLSTSLAILSLLFNNISGSIPKDIGNLVNLTTLELDGNSFTGTLPSSLGRLRNLQLFSVPNNRIHGQIPLVIGNLTQLNTLELETNVFSGRIPHMVGNLTELLELNLASNNLIGKIPSAIFSITTLSTILDLSDNNLEGPIPQEIGNLKNLVEFHAESNKLSGEIPNTLGECQLLQNVYLQNNFLNGTIPPLLSQLKGLDNLDLSNNKLSGQIPKFLGYMKMLHYLNLSFNSFVGDVPNFGVFANATAISIEGNDKLCGGIADLHLHPCSLESGKRMRTSLAIPIVISTIAIVVILLLLYKFLTWRKKSKAKLPLTTPMQEYPLISYSQLLKATDGFSTTNLLGSGTFGSVYKGKLDGRADESDEFVAVKVLKLQTPGAQKSFTAECEALRKLRHRNLVKVITACSSIDTRGNDFKAIVFEFMPYGSLEGWLHPDTNYEIAEQKFLNLFQRVAILLDVAYALDYLHSQGPMPIVHCDIKSSNVLLDADMVAHVGDFGLAKILVEGSSFSQQSSGSMGFRGTIGYAAPEYGAGNMVSTNGDIYSYGILVLEIVTGRRPNDSGFSQGLSLREYVDLGLHDRVMDVVDSRLLLDLKNERGASDGSSYQRSIGHVISLLRLGVSLSQETPSSRMLAAEIVNDLHAMKESLLK